MKDITSYIIEATQRDYTDVLVHFENEYLILRRANYIKRFGGKWCLPGGHVENGESTIEAAIRELKEETSIEIGQQMMQSFKFKYRNGDESEIFVCNLTEKPEVKISREHAQYKWVTYDEFKSKYIQKFIPEICDEIDKIMKEFEK